jgi:hypothetical protein
MALLCVPVQAVAHRLTRKDKTMDFKNIKSITQFMKEKEASDKDKGFEFRGIVFAATGKGVRLADLNQLYLVFRALEGDQLAIDLLNTAGTVVSDINKKQIWPVVDPKE